MGFMLNNTSLSRQNYDNTLVGWSGQAVESDVELGAEELKYCNGKTARQRKYLFKWNWNKIIQIHSIHLLK